MSTDDTRAAASRASLSNAWVAMSDRWSTSREFIARFLKYSFLLVALLLTTKVVFDGYSYYVARRSIDAELEAKKISSLEYLNVLQQRERALIRETLETRCAERVEIALFRVFTALKETKLRDYYAQTMEVKSPLVAEIKENGPKFLDRWKDAVDFVNSATFTVAEFNDKHLKKLSTVNETDQAYKDFIGQVRKHLHEYNDLVLANPELQKLAHEAQEETQNHWRQQAVNTLEDRLKRLKEERATIRKDLVGNLDEILARYAVWTDALTGGSGQTQLLDEMAVEAKREDQGALSDVNCQRLKQYNPAEYAALERAATATAPADKAWMSAPTAEKINRIVDWYNDRLFAYFKQPPAAQTLFVTLFMGALGGLTVNVLRLSQLGWWRGQKDPLWGEIFVSPILGALAALAVYLLGSAGLLLTSDFRASQTGASPLAASFIGLLGFLSGFLYDAAFGRVRRVGAQLFAGETTSDQAPSASEEDRSLAEVLKGANASLIAGLVLSYGIGSKLASESEFTFLVPSDHAVGQLPLATWKEITDKSANAFDKWYKHHHASKRKTKKELAGPPPTSWQLELDDGKTIEVKMEANELKIGATKAIVADVAWKKGVIHILQDELAP
jgi:uncharacterized surface protein with fasciclin (FAS1) repeats